MAPKVGKPPMQCFVQELGALQRTRKHTTSIQNGTFPPSISHVFLPYSKRVCPICNTSAAIPKPSSGPKLKYFGWLDHVELVILKVSPSQKSVGTLDYIVGLFYTISPLKTFKVILIIRGSFHSNPLLYITTLMCLDFTGHSKLN